MIGFLRGRIMQKKPPLLLLDVQGVGYEIQAPMTTFYTLPGKNHDVELFTHLVIREDAHTLFGFATENERHLFRTLIKINGVGAKMALTILSGIEADEFAFCVQNNDVTRLIGLPGVGKKTAERLIVEMRDRLDSLTEISIGAGTGNATPIDRNDSPVGEAVSALIALGYKPSEASQCVYNIASEDLDSEALIRQALKNLAKK